jgi:UDP-N-acetylmuramyl pentapeptide synthase
MDIVRYIKSLRNLRVFVQIIEKVQKGQIFVALKGDNFNGNNFAIQAIADGAAYAIVDEK